MIEDKKQISTWQPRQLINRLDDYLKTLEKTTGEPYNRTLFITRAIREKLDKEA